MVSIETPLPAWSCHTGTMAIFTFMACLEIGRVLLNVRIVPPNPRGGDNTDWIGGYNTDTLYMDMDII